MTWKLKKEAENWQPIPGVPWQDMTDDEYKAVSAEYDKQYDEKGSLKKYFEHVKDEKPKKGGE
jgi:hypothetical protein